MPSPRDLQAVGAYYAQKLEAYGATARGVDWNSEGSQAARFDQLLKVCEGRGPFSLNDYGCGYGALLSYVRDRGFVVDYRGFDIVPEMISMAQACHAGVPDSRFFTDRNGLAAADYSVASGIFNVRLGTPEPDWERHIFDTLEDLAALSRRGFAFNILSSYSDPAKRGAHLYYADPLEVFHHCKSDLSRYVSLLHDYPLYEFTVIVRK